MRASTQSTAEYFGDMLGHLHPEVQSALPGSLDRETEVWIQQVLRRWYDEEERPEAMGFTILSKDLRPGRIHLREDTSFRSGTWPTSSGTP